MTRTSRPVALAALLLLAAAGPAIARPEMDPIGRSSFAAPAIATNGSAHRVPRAGSAIDVDGRLDDAAWADALRFELDYEVRPGENVAPPVRTDCLVIYDDRALYVGFRADDPDPELIRARLSDRDRAWNDDWVGIVLDTFNDQRRAYELIANPLGVQIDAINDEVGGSYDDSWNAIWDSRGSITENGYEVELEIPFDQIRFQGGSGEQTWGFDAIRSYPRGDRHHIGLFPRDRNKNSYLSQTVKLVGMAGADPGRNLEVVPTLTASSSRTEALPNGQARASDSDADVGATVRWGVTPNITLNATVNPDFSQVEADAVQLDVNEQFALFFRETRPFFLEQADFFNTPLDLVYTRTVADPSAALKLTGKLGRNTLGVFVARDDVTNVVVPGSQGSTGGSFDTENTTTVARYRWDFGGSSTIGAVLTDRRGDGYSNTVLAVDGLWRLSDEDTVGFGLGLARTEYSDAMRGEFRGSLDDPDTPLVDEASERIDGRLEDPAFRAWYNHSERGWWINAHYEDYGREWRSDVGFRPRVDFSKWVFGGARVWWGEDGQFFNRMAWGADVDRTVTADGDLLEEEIESWWNANLARDSFVRFGAGRRNRVFDDVEFAQWFASSYIGGQITRNWHLEMSVSWTDWIDFANTRPAERWNYRPSMRATFGRHLRLDLSYLYQTLDVDSGRLFTIHVPELRFVSQFSTRAFARAIVQYSRVEGNPTEFDVGDRLSEGLLAQLLFSYKVNPATAVYLGYTDDLVGTDAYDLTRSGRSLFLKLGYAWSP